MKTHSKQPNNNTSALQAKAKNQAPEGSILQAYKKGTAQLQSLEEEEPVQGKFETAQLEELAEEDEEPAQLKENKTGLPDNLKSGVESISGHSMDDVKVHYNSAKPAELQAHAYAQGTDIHVAPGQEKHLPHEAWHVVQQKQGRVKPTKQLKGTTPVNDDTGLEKEADVMGAKANSFGNIEKMITENSAITQPVLQGAFSGPVFTTHNPINIDYDYDFDSSPARPHTGCGTNNQIVTDGQLRNNGASAPGSPTNLDTYKDGFSRNGGLVRDPARNQTSTRLHLINHRLENSGNTQNVASNIFLGSQRANNPTHLNNVEKHVIRSLSYATQENADYEDSMAQAQQLNTVAGTQVTYWHSGDIPPANVLPAHFHNIGWIDNGAVSNTPPLSPSKKKKINNGTGVAPAGVYINPLTKALPKHLWVDYQVRGNYNGAPQFVTDNVTHERTQNGGVHNPTDPVLEQTIQEFVTNWKNNAFPTDFDSDASYYFASWIPGAPYHEDNEPTENIATDL